MNTSARLAAVMALAFLAPALIITYGSIYASGQDPPIPTWTHLSTETGDLDPPGQSTQQTGSLVLDIDKDNLNDFVIYSRNVPGPAVVWYERTASGWNRHIIETDAMRVEAGGAFYDIDGDTDLDIAIGGDGSSNMIWWWENPYPTYDDKTDWTRHVIKNSGGYRHHDLMFGNFDDDNGAELVFWNQSVKQLFIVNVPADPATTEPWPGQTAIATAASCRFEGLAQGDVNGDDETDIVAGGRWYEHVTGFTFTPHLIESAEWSRIAVGQLKPGGWMEIVQSPGDKAGMARWYERVGDDWVGHDLLAVDNGHSLAIGDVNQDSHLDIFLGEMRFDASDPQHNPDARTLALLGDGEGNFTTVTIATGIGQHESRLADLDGDTDLDILGKPYSWDTPRVDIWLTANAQVDPPETPTPMPAPDDLTLTSGTVYASSTTGGATGGVTFADEDILAFDVVSKKWSLFFDGSDVGLGGADVDAFYLAPDNQLYLSFEAVVANVPELGPVDDSDIVVFTGTLGPATSGSFAWYFDGSDVELTLDGEDIDAMGLGPDGTLLLSARGGLKVTGLSAADEDLVQFRATSTGADTSGSWALYFDGSDVDLGADAEDITGLWLDPSSGMLYLTFSGYFTVDGAKGDDDDILRCQPLATGPASDCIFGPGVSWNGGLYGFGSEKLDGMTLAAPSP